MEPIGIALVCAFTLCIFLFAVRSVCLRVTRSKMLEDALPFTVYATIRRADDAEYIVRSVLERVLEHPAGAGSGKLLGPQQTEQVAHQLHNGRKKALAGIAHHQNDPCCRAYDIKKK